MSEYLKKVSESRCNHPYNSDYKKCIDKNTKKLIIGTIPPQRFCSENELIDGDMDFYYGSANNRFWTILESIFPAKFKQQDINSIVKFLEKDKIAFYDVVKSCNRIDESSSDSSLCNIELDCDIKKILYENENINQLFYTSQFVYSLMGKFADNKCHTKDGSNYKIKINKREIPVIILKSPSRRNTMSEEDLSEQYKKVFLNQ